MYSRNVSQIAGCLSEPSPGHSSPPEDSPRLLSGTPTINLPCFLPFGGCVSKEGTFELGLKDG